VISHEFKAIGLHCFSFIYLHTLTALEMVKKENQLHVDWVLPRPEMLAWSKGFYLMICELNLVWSATTHGLVPEFSNLLS